MAGTMRSLTSIVALLTMGVLLALTVVACGGGGGGTTNPPPHPVANAGADQRVLPGSVVTLDGSGSSDATGSPLSYSWELVAFPPYTATVPVISGASSVNPTFTADQSSIGSYEIELSVVNGRGQHSSDIVMVTASSSRLPDTGQTGDYTATLGEDSDYALNVPSYTSYPNAPRMVTDNVTGLLWQKQDDAFPRSKLEAAAYCANLPLADSRYSGWRLPTAFELISIMDYGRTDPAIDTAFFSVEPFYSYWTSIPTADKTNAWAIYSNGQVSYGGYLNYARCVRGTQISPPVFTDNADGTVTDAATALMWQKQDDGAARIWDVALSYCEGLSLAGHSDWRLPNIKELYSIVDASKISPAIDTNYFPGTLSANYWSSTTTVFSTANAWTVNFSLGDTGGGLKTGGPAPPPYSNVYTRCVRGGM